MMEINIHISPKIKANHVKGKVAERQYCYVRGGKKRKNKERSA